MYKSGWRMSCKVCVDSIRKWRGDARIAAIMILAFLFEWILIADLRHLCDEYQLSFSCWFFVFLFKGIQAMFHFFGILLLFCDAPFVDKQQMDVILRVGKKNWFRGKILYIITASLLYFLYLFFISIAAFWPNVGFTLKWGELISVLSAQHNSVLRRDIVAYYTPLEAFGVQFMVCMMFAVFLGLLIFYMNLFKYKNLGAGIACTLILTGGISGLNTLNGSRLIVYFVPMMWTDIELYIKDSGGIPLAYAVTLLGIGIMVLIGLIIRKSKKYNIECQSEM